MKAELWRVAKLGEQAARTFDEAALRFLAESEGQKNYTDKARHVIYWRGVFSGKSVRSLTTQEIIDALPTHVTREHQASRPLAPATRNRYLATMRRLLNLCAEWGWINAAPKLRAAKEPKVRIRWITQEEARRLLSSVPHDWLRDLMAFALATGMRAGEILSLTWADVDIERSIAWITADRAKSGKARAVPLNPEAVAVVRRRIGTHEQRVFTRNGSPQYQVDAKAFGRACKAAGITAFHFHDLRHTWASWHVQAGTPLFVLKELGGWETLEMVKKYAHMDGSHLAQFAGAVTFWAQSEPKKKIAA